jgi:RimJ/RimL family protein N-acetyltransferase
VKGAIVISAGFKEVGPEGAALEAQILEHARRGKMRVIGPNCLGVMNPLTGLNATFAAATAGPGNVAFVSQSGALCTSVLDWSLREHVGFSAFVSIGSMLDVGWGDLIYHLGDDPHTQSIVMYMETIGDARSFMSAAREVALTKPIIVIKPGRTEGAARAAASHTGSLTGSDEVLDTAFRRCGVLRVQTIGEIFSMTEVLAKQPRPKGPRLTILTNAGGPGVLAVDALLTSGGQLAELSTEAMLKLNEILPPQWSHGNPVDILGDASPERYAQALEVTAQDEDSDGLLVVLTPQAMTDPTATAEALKDYARSYDKPILASWSGGQGIAALEQLLVHFGQLVAEQRWIKELDINPLLASHAGLLALDARVVIHDAKHESELPRLAIRPYPSQYVAPWTMKDGESVVIRPIRAEDEMLMRRFHGSLSDETVYQRYLSPLQVSTRTAHERLARVTHNDYDREIALVAEGEDNGERAILGVGRLSKLHGTGDEARFTMLVSDRYQGKGLGRELLTRIVQIGRDEKIKRIIALMSPENETMKSLCRSVGFSSFEIDPENGLLKAQIEL